MKSNLSLNRLLNADGEVVGYFSDHTAEMAAREEWAVHSAQHRAQQLRSLATSIVAIELEDVDIGDGDRVDCVFWRFESNEGHDHGTPRVETQRKATAWLSRGAASVEVRRYLINRYRRPGMSNRDADFGGPVEAAGVLYVLDVKAPK